MRTYIENIQIQEALKETAAIRKVLLTLKRMHDPLERARVLRAVVALFGLDE